MMIRFEACRRARALCSVVPLRERNDSMNSGMGSTPGPRLTLFTLADVRCRPCSHRAQGCQVHPQIWSERALRRTPWRWPRRCPGKFPATASARSEKGGWSSHRAALHSNPPLGDPASTRGQPRLLHAECGTWCGRWALARCLLIGEEGWGAPELKLCAVAVWLTSALLAA